MISKVKNYFISVVEESKKIVWPNKTKLVYDSATVIVFLIATGFIVAAIDGGFTKLFEIALERLG